jgi:hypothetical protein
MRIERWTCTAGLALLLPAPALAAPPDDDGFRLGARTGVAFALGDLESGTRISDRTTLTIPLWLDAGLRIGSHFYGGLYALGALGVPKCSGCSVQDLGLGIDLAYHALPGTTFDPWIALSVGLEVFHVGQSDASLTYHGNDVGLTLGGDLTSGRLRFGPIATFAGGQFESVDRTGAPTVEIQGTSTSTHFWVTIGARGAVDL